MTGPNIQALQGVTDRANRSSNAGTVGAIATTGHVASAGVLTAGGFAAAMGGAATFKCFAGRVAAPIAGAFAGAWVAEKMHADDWVLKQAEKFGATALAKPGRLAAHVTHQIAHSNAFKGLVTGILVGIVVGAGVALGAAAVIGTAGMAAPLVGAAVAFGAGAVGGFVTTAIAGAGAKSGTLAGPIVSGSPNVIFEGKPAARVGDAVACTQHSSSPVIIEGSRTIMINGMPMSRVGHKTSCNAVIQEGCATVLGDDTTASFGTPDADLSVAEQLALSIFEVAGATSAAREGGLLDGALRKLFGEPVDVVTGDYADTRLDFEYPSVLPLRLSRTYPGRMRVEGQLGPRWICSWSQRLVFAEDGTSVLLEDADGQRLRFALPAQGPIDSVHLKAPQYRLTGDRGEARLFDSRTQQTLVFTPATAFTSRMSAIEDANANRIAFAYEADRLVRIAHSDGVSFHVETTPEGWLTTLRMDGREETLVRYAYDAAGGLADVEGLFTGEFHYGYTPQGWMAQWRDSGATQVEIAYDAEGRVVATRGPDGLFDDRFAYAPAERRSQYTDALGAVRTFWWNADDLVVREEDPLGGVTVQEWDALERRVSATDALGRVTRYGYDDGGRLVEAADWAGRSTRWAYDRDGRLLVREAHDGRRDAFAYDARGNVAAWVGADGVEERYAYDARGRLLSVEGPGGTQARWELDGAGRPCARSDALGRRTTCAFDVFGRLLSATDAKGATTRYAYDVSTANPRGAVASVTRADGGATRYGYDAEGLLAVRERAEGQTTRYRYGAFDLLRQVEDAAGHLTAFDYDGAGRLTGLTDAKGLTWAYAYDGAGRLAAEVDWGGRRTQHLRDPLGRLRLKVLPDLARQRFAYDDRDRIVRVACGEVGLAYAYDDADRLVRAATYRPGPEDEDDAATDFPALVQTDVTLGYDAAGRLVEEVQNGRRLAYAYDAAGRRIGRVSPSGRTELQFDAAGGLAALETNGCRLDFERDDLGLETRRAVAGPPVATAFALRQSYDLCGRLTAQRAGRDGPAAPPAEISRRYAWDRSGRLVGVADDGGARTRNRYDPRDQVVRVDRAGGTDPDRLEGETYAYDALMNLAASAAGEHGYWRDCVVRAGADSYRYDPRGRMIERRQARDGFRPRVWAYRWDDFDRMVGLTTPEGARWAYVYDAFGRRVSKAQVDGGEGGGDVDYVWQGAALAEAWRGPERPGAPALVERWHYEPGGFRPLAKEVVDAPASGADAFAAPEARLYPIVADALGTPKAMFDAAGACVWRAEHALWGRARTARELTAARGGGAESAELSCDLRYQNQWADAESGLHYNLNRHYDPDSGQYLSPDPIGLDGGARTHAYVHDPVQWVDPLGLADTPGTIKYPVDPSLTPQPGSYSSGINRAWSQEGQLVQTTGSGTVDWTDAQKAQLLNEGRVSGYTGHHINNAASAPDWEGDPRNIRFLQNGRSGTTNDHLDSSQGHRGNWQNETKGRLIDRKAMIDRFKASCGR